MINQFQLGDMEPPFTHMNSSDNSAEIAIFNTMGLPLSRRIIVLVRILMAIPAYTPFVLRNVHEDHSVMVQFPVDILPDDVCLVGVGIAEGIAVKRGEEVIYPPKGR